jgi:NADH-quinone oxidoreductase subunit M
MLYERTHTRTIAAFGGLAKVMPVYTTCFIIVTLSSIGLPLTNGFIGEFACLFGAFQQNPWWAALGGLGVILGAVYMLNLVKEVFFGKLGRPGLQQLPDLSRRELGLLLPILVMIFVMGVAPRPFFQRLDPAVNRFLRQAHPATARAPVEVVKEVAAMPPDEARR